MTRYNMRSISPFLTPNDTSPHWSREGHVTAFVHVIGWFCYGHRNIRKFVLIFLFSKTQLQLLLLLNFANTKKVLEKRLIFVLFFGGTNFIQKINSISKYRPRLMKLSETHEDISELVWKKFGWWNFIPSWSKFCEHVLFSLFFGMNGNCILAYINMEA